MPMFALKHMRARIMHRALQFDFDNAGETTSAPCGR